MWNDNAHQNAYDENRGSGPLHRGDSKEMVPKGMAKPYRYRCRYIAIKGPTGSTGAEFSVQVVLCRWLLGFVQVVAFLIGSIGPEVIEMLI